MFSLLFYSARSATQNLDKICFGGCAKLPEGATKVNDLDGEISTSTKTAITAYIDGEASLKLASVGARNIKFIGIGDKDKIAITKENTVKAGEAPKPAGGLGFQDIAATFNAGEISLASFEMYNASFNHLTEGTSMKVISESMRINGNSLLNSAASFEGKNVFIKHEECDEDFSLKNDKYIPSSDAKKAILIKDNAEITLSKKQLKVDVAEMTKNVKIVPTLETKIYLEADASLKVLTIDNSANKVEIASHNKDTLDVKLTNQDNVIKNFLEKVSDKLNAGQIIGVIIAAILCIASILACVFIVRCEARVQKEEEARLTETEIEEQSSA